MENFGSKLRSLRETKGLGLRELARKANISPAFLSKIESGKEKPPAEKKIKALARALGENADFLLALSGRLPADVQRTIQRHPLQYIALIRDLRKLNAKELEQVRDRFTVTRIPISSEEMHKFQEVFGRGRRELTRVEIYVEEDSPASASRVKNEATEKRE